jgi:hypothetical protein
MYFLFSFEPDGRPMFHARRRRGALPRRNGRRPCLEILEERQLLSLSLKISGFPTPSTAGTAGAFSIAVYNADGTIDTAYKGTVHFTSSDAQAVLPVDYTFTAADAGQQAFSARLETARTQSITATDEAVPSIKGSETGIAVQPAALSALAVTSYPATDTIGTANSFTVTAVDGYGNTITNYTGTVHFTSTDPQAILPADYTFVAANFGRRTFSATFDTFGSQTLVATDTANPSVGGAQAGIAVQLGPVHTYYVSPTPTSGAGTFADPFGLTDLVGANNVKGPALSVLKPGDTLYFLAGTYNFTGSSDPIKNQLQLISSTSSGTAWQPITLQAYPQADVDLVEQSGVQPVLGTSGPLLNYVRFLGFTVDPGPGQAGVGGAAIYLHGTGNEVGFSTVIGHDVAVVTNHDGILLGQTHDTWIHNNIISGVTGIGDNSSGIKQYYSDQYLIEDNYIYGCNVGIHDKAVLSPDGSSQGVYARNYITNNIDFAFLGNVQGAQAVYYIHDNVFVGVFHIGWLNTGSELYNNLIFSATPFVAGANVWNQNFWNNIVISGGKSITAYQNLSMPLVLGGSQAPLQFMDYNVYDGQPSYLFCNSAGTAGVAYTLAQMQAAGFEQHATVVSSDLAIFQNLASYQLLPQWETAGRYGDPVGPRYPIARIMDSSRYGAAALGAASNLSISQQPQNQIVSVGATATFSVEAIGSWLTYQWQRSNNGGRTWLTVQNANSATLTVPNVSLTDSGAVFRCLIASSDGSAWSSVATLTIPLRPRV